MSCTANDIGGDDELRLQIYEFAQKYGTDGDDFSNYLDEIIVDVSDIVIDKLKQDSTFKRCRNNAQYRDDIVYNINYLIESIFGILVDNATYKIMSDYVNFLINLVNYLEYHSQL